MRYAILGIICAVFMISCTADDTENYNVGSDFLDSTIDIKVIDTFTINTGTYKLDSVITSGTSRILLGHVNDNYLGEVTAQSYFQIQNSIFSISDDAVYDSIGFILNYDTYHYGDTLKPQTYKIFEITETFEPKDDGTDFFNTSYLEYDDELLGELSFTPRPNRSTDSVYIPMSYELGERIFNQIGDNEINSSDDFLQYFKGLTIIPDTISNSHILGFNGYSSSGMIDETSSGMRMYYTVKEGDTEGESSYIDFVISSDAKQFNAVKSDISTTAIKDATDVENVIPSSETDDIIYAQAGTGISARINIPSIKRLDEISEVGTPLGASLTFKPLKGTYDEFNPLKESLSVYVVDHKNRILNLLTDADGSTAYAILNQDDEEFDSNTYYSVDLSGYVEDIFNTNEDLNYSLMIQFVDINKSVDRVIIDASDNEDDRVKLTVKYLKY